MAERRQVVGTAAAMIAGMTPVLDPASYVFVTLAPGAAIDAGVAAAIAVFRESEGVSLVVEAGAAAGLGLPAGPRMRRIELRVYSDLEGVGLTAAVATALARRAIACNVIAAFHHDHVFVPADRADDALAVLEALQRAGA